MMPVPCGVRPVLLVLAVLLNISAVFSQVLGPPTTAAGTTGPPPIIIEGCPPVVPTAYTPNAQQRTVSVIWDEPFSTDRAVSRSTDFPSGSTFGLGINEVIYIFTDGVRNTALCTFNVTVVLGPPPIIIIGCPPVLPTAYIPSAGRRVRVSWEEPFAIISSISRSTDRPSGSLFPLGVNIVIYTFSDGAGNADTCAFNVTVVLQCGDTTDIACNNGVCVPQTTLCDGYNDCGDNFPFGTDEMFGECLFSTLEKCNTANPKLYSACSTTTDYVIAEDYVSSSVFKLRAPSSSTQSTYLSRVMVNVTGVINLAQLALDAPILFITINVPALALTTTVRSHLASRRSSNTPLIVTEDLRQPLPVAQNDEIEITLEFDHNVLDTRPPFPIEIACLECVSLQYRTMTSGCGNTTCFDAYISWRNLMVPSLISGTACGVTEQNDIIDSLYSSCLSTPQFVYVSESRASFIEDRIILKCTAEGQVPPLVEWYNDRMEVVASGPGYAAFDVFVSETLMSFTCMLEKKIRYDKVVTVSQWSAECDQLFQSLIEFQPQGSCQVSLSQPLATNVNIFTNVYSFRPTSPMVAFQFSLESSALIVPSGGQFPNPNGPDETIAVLLPIRLRITYPLRRKRRAAELTSIYERDYANVYVSSSALVALEIDPPVKLNADVDVDIQVTVLQPVLLIEFERPPPSYRLEAMECIDRNGTSCVDFTQDWYQAQQAFEAAKCTKEKNLVLEAFQICENTSAAEPQIIRHPRSVDITSMSTGRRSALMTCDIENAVRYSWYKVAPSPRRTFIKTGSTLSFPNVVLNDVGSYVCVGTGGVPFDTRLETRPATLIVEGFSVFKVTATLVNIEFTSNLTNPDSQEFQRLKTDVEAEIGLPFLEGQALNASNIRLEVTEFRQGSVIADLIMLVAGVLVPDDVTVNIIAAEVARIQSEFLFVMPDSVKVVSLVTCFKEQVVGENGNVTFPQTRIGQTAQSMELCPEVSLKAGMALGTRECAGDLLSEAYWLGPEFVDCYGDGNVNFLLEDLSRFPVTPENAPQISQETVDLTSEHEKINTTGIIAVADILENLLNAGEPSVEVAVDIIRIVNNILQVDDLTYDDLGNDNSTSRIILSLEAYITALQTNGDARNLTQVLSDIAVSAVQLPREALKLGLGFAAVPTSSGLDNSLLNDDVMVYYDPESIPVVSARASISLPPEILDFVNEGDEVKISFFFYLNSKLFRSPMLRASQRPQDKFRRAVGSNVIAATVEGVRIENLPVDAPVVGTFQPLNVSSPQEIVNGTECVFWDFTLNNGFGDWSTKGCQVAAFDNGNPVCHCDHLTSFAVIVDIYGNQASVALSIISKIGCAVSIVALIITIVTYLAIKKFRIKRPQQILVSFSFALLGLYLIFLVGIDATASRIGCIIVAVLIHYFTLASVAWMAVEAANMYLLFVRILNANVRRFLLKASILAWGLPLVVVIVILAVDHTNYQNDNFCFLNMGNAFYYGQILLIGLVLVVNFIIFTLVMRQLTCARKGISSTTDKTKRQETIRRLQNAFSISVLLGLTWVFGLLSLIQTANFAFQVLFCIFNSLQGLMIFILFCVRQEEIRKAWVDFVTCRWKKDRTADYRKTGGQSRDKDSQPHGNIPLTSHSTGTNSTGTHNTGTQQ